MALILGAPGGACAEGVSDDRSEESSGQERQIRYLSAALAAAQSENDLLRARLDGKTVATGDGSAPRLMEGGARVLDASRELGVLVMDAGSRQGIKAGMILMVMREKQALARVRVVDVRRRVAGAVIEDLLSGAPYPGAGDRLVLVTDGK